MKVKDAIFAMQQLDPEMDLLVEATDGGLPYAVANVQVSSWEDEDDGTKTPVAMIGVVH